MGDDFVFEDNDEEAPIWTFEDRLAGDASQRPEATPAAEPRGVLDPQMADVLSAYSTEQGMVGQKQQAAVPPPSPVVGLCQSSPSTNLVRRR